MEIKAFTVLVIPFIVVAYLAVLLFLRPPRVVLLASLLGGLFMGVINVLVDLAAYYAHWWHYTLNGLILHVPLPLYITPVLVYGSIAYLLIWRFWTGRLRWLSLVLLYGVPVFCILRDILGAVTTSSYTVWENAPLAAVFTVLMWLVMFFGGYFLFNLLAPAHQTLEDVQEKEVHLEKTSS